MAAPRFKPDAQYVIPGNILNIIWDEVCEPFLNAPRPPADQKKLEQRLGIVLNSAVEDTFGRSRFNR